MKGSRSSRPWFVTSMVAVLLGLALAAVPIVAGTSPAAARPLGQVYGFGSAADHGSPGRINLPVVGMASTSSGNGYWVTATDGGVFAHGDAAFYGSTGSIALNKPVVGMAATPSGKGYWFVASDGGIFAFGDAGFFGSTGGTTLNKPIVGMAATPSGRGYWLVASDGGIFAFGDARFLGSMGGTPLNRPIVGMAATPSGLGYWLVASDGGVFAFGDARFFGSTGGMRLNRPIVGMAATLTGDGYWFVADDGGIFAFGAAGFFGALGGTPLSGPVVGMARPTPRNDGYWLLDAGNQNPDVCITDPASEDPDTAGHARIDILNVCLHATPGGIVVDITVRSGMTRDQLLASMRNQSSETADSTFYDLYLFKDTGFGPGSFVTFGAEGNNVFADIYTNPDDPNEVPRHVGVGLTVAGATYTFGPVPYEGLPTNDGIYYFAVETTEAHAIGSGDFDVFIDDAPASDAGAPAGPVTRA